MVDGMKIEIGNEFLFNIKLIDFAEDTYDVKIDILESGDRVARILNNGEWKSTYYYVVDIIKQDEEKEFSLNITEYIGNSNIEIRIRDSNGDSKKFDNYEIESFAGEVEEIIETESTEIIEELNETSEDVLSNEIKEEILELPEKNTSKKITGLSIEENAKESFPQKT